MLVYALGRYEGLSPSRRYWSPVELMDAAEIQMKKKVEIFGRIV